MQKNLLLILFLSLFAGPLVAQNSGTPDVNDLKAALKPVKWRSIGPFRGGRSNSATGVIGDPKTYYMGTTGGGLWKTDDMGNSWRNISDARFGNGAGMEEGIHRWRKLSTAA